MAWILKYTEFGDPFYAWDEDEPVPEGELAPPSPTHQPIDLSPDLPFEGPVRSPLRTNTPDPIEQILQEAEQATRPRTQIDPSVLPLPTGQGKIAEHRAPLPSFTEMFPNPTGEGLPEFERTGPERAAPGQMLPPKAGRALVDALASPFVRTYQAGSGQMSEAQQRNFTLNAGLGAVGGGPIMGALGSIIGAAQAEEVSPEQKPLIPIETHGGSVNLSAIDLRGMGYIGAATLGMAYAPRVFGKLYRGALPYLPKYISPSRTPRPVANAAPGTEAISTPIDLFRTYDDVNAGGLRLMRAAGVDPITAARVTDVFHLQTRSTTNALTEAAVNTGRMETPTYTFQVRTPLSRLKQVENQQVRDYLHVLDTLDQIKLQSKINMNNPQAGPIVVLGLDQPAADQIRRSLEAANPQLKQIAAEYNRNLRAMRKFESEGEYATIPLRDRNGTPVGKQRSRAFLNANRPNEVPWRGGRVTGDPVERGSAIESLETAMRERMRARMENEAVGMYVDEMRRVNPNLFTRVTGKQLKANPNWRKNVVAFKRRGKTEYYTTDPFVADFLKMDPYYMHQMLMPLYSTKRLFEMTTTGELAPWFAPTSAIRSFKIGRQVKQEGRKPPSVSGTLHAIPEQSIAKLAQIWGQRFEGASGGWFGKVLGPQFVQGMSRRMLDYYNRSFFAQLESVGGGRGSMLQQQMQAGSRLQSAINDASGWGRAFLESYRALLNSVHNAPSYNYASRNRGKAHLAKIASEARHMTGDPRRGGQFYVGGIFQGHPVRFENRSSRVSHTVAQVGKWTYGVATEAGRTAIPWFNATQQGMKRIGESYLQDPASFTGRMWLYEIMPAVASYSWAQSLGNDPSGRSYAYHMMYGRSEYEKLMNLWIAVPGRPVSEGINIPRYHETSVAGHLAEIGMHHAWGTNLFNLQEDFAKAAAGFADVLLPPAPPAANLFVASLGYSVPQGGLFAGEAFRKKSDPFDQNGGLPASIDLYARAMAAGLADIVGEGYAAATQTPEGFLSKARNGAAAMTRRVIEKTPVVRDITNIKPAMSGNNTITAEMFKKRKAIRDLENYYKEWTRGKGLIGDKPRSRGGEIMAESHLGERPPSEGAGLNQPPATNPLYIMFAEMLHKKFAVDSPWQTPTGRGMREKDWERDNGVLSGGIGFQSLFQRHGIATKNLQRLRKVNEGNMVTWQRQLQQRPDELKYLKRNSIDPTNLKQVRNFYEKQRQDAARVILFQIKAVEAEMSEALGRPVKIEDLHPYGKGFEGPAQEVEETAPEAE